MKNKYLPESDTSFVTTAKYYGFSIDSIDATDPERVIFCIKRDDGLDELVKAYWSDQLSVNPKKFSYVSKEIKSMLFKAIEMEKRKNENK